MYFPCMYSYLKLHSGIKYKSSYKWLLNDTCLWYRTTNKEELTYPKNGEA